MAAEEFWDDFTFRFGPWSFGFGGYGGNVRYARTENAHILRIKIDPEVKKEEIKARLVKPGLIEVEWPRKVSGEEIPVE